MKAMRLICLTLIVLAMGGVNSAFAESGAVTIYKQQVAKIVDTWNQTMTRFNDEIVKDNATIESLKAQNPPTRDADNKIAALRADIASAKNSMELATRTAEVDLGTLEFKPARKDEGLPLPQFVKEIIAAKGIPLTKTISIAPAASWNWKSNTLGSLAVRFNFKLKNF